MTDPFDDDKTVLKSGPTREPPAAGAPSQAEPDDHHALPTGTRLGEFEITGLVGVGGFGIVYLAHDHSLGRIVALKEYMPSSLAARTAGMSVVVRTQRDADTFAAGMRSFINEARLLAQFDHPSLVKVYRFWEANGTAYMVMPFYEGLTLKQTLLAMSAPPSEDWLMALLDALVDALQVIHRQDCFHRDIAPDNILLLKDGRPVLLDFGAARRAIGDMAKNLTVILKPGYAPIEQYSEDASVSQGAWTDIYALAAVVHYAITGRPPAPSVTRLLKDSVVPLETSAHGKYSSAFLRVVDRALAVRPEQRPQSVGELRTLLAPATRQTQPPPPPKATEPVRATLPPAVPRSRSPRGWMVGVGLAVLIAAAGAFFLIERGNDAATSATASPPAATPAPEPAPQVTKAQDPQPPAPAAPVQAKPFDPLDALTELVDRRASDRAVEVGLEQARVKIGKDQLRFRVLSAKAGYLYVVMVGTDRAHINLLFPNALDSNNKIAAGQELSLPRAGWSMTAEGPAGINQFVAMVSEYPVDFAESGLAKLGPFAEFPLDTVARQMRENAGAAALAGKPKCPSSTGCVNAYGAARFLIEEVD